MIKTDNIYLLYNPSSLNLYFNIFDLISPFIINFTFSFISSFCISLSLLIHLGKIFLSLFVSFPFNIPNIYFKFSFKIMKPPSKSIFLSHI